MGKVASKFHNLLDDFNEKYSAKILMLGLDAAGKTTILYKIKRNEIVQTTPTIGFNIENINMKGIHFTVWDVCGQDRIRPLWNHYFQDIVGVLFVVDSNDTERLPEAREELFKVINNDQIQGVPFVIVANKQDLPNAMKPSDVAYNLGLYKLTSSKWHVEGACAKTGEGLYESMKAMADLVKTTKTS